MIGVEQATARNHSAQRQARLSEGRRPSVRAADFSLYPDPLATADKDGYEESEEALGHHTGNRSIFASGIIRDDPKSAE